MPRHVVVNPGTSVGLTELAERENADVIVFGSEYRTAAGTVKPGISAHKLLLGARRRSPWPPPACASIPRSASTPSASSTRGTRAAETAESLASALGASVVEFKEGGRVDLLVVGSRPEAPAGKVVLSASSDYAVEAATFPVLVVRGVSRSTLRVRPAASA